MLAQGQSSSAKRGGLAAVSSGLIFLKKKDKILPFVTTRKDLEGITLSKINQREKDKYHMISLIRG